jgi:hypothetical protein
MDKKQMTYKESKVLNTYQYELQKQRIKLQKQFQTNNVRKEISEVQNLIVSTQHSC